MTTPTSKNLIVVRHAKAEPSAATDHARPLAPRGLHDAQAAGQWLAKQQPGRLLGLVSTAVRARQTWDELAARVEAHSQAMDGLYQAGTDEVIETLHLVDDAEQRVAVVGHNPTMERLVAELSDGGSAADAAMATRGFATGAIAVLRHHGVWSELRPGSCLLADFHVARAL